MMAFNEFFAKSKTKDNVDLFAISYYDLFKEKKKEKTIKEIEKDLSSFVKIERKGEVHEPI